MKTALLGMLGLLLVPCLHAPAHADGVVYLASTGIDSNPCTRTAPCRSVSAALGFLSAGGQINCLDSGPINVDVAFVSRTFTLDCTALAFVSSTGIAINGNSAVTIRNLTFNGLFGFSGTSAIQLFSGDSTLFVQNCKFEQFFNGSPAILVNPNSGSTQVVVTDTVMTANTRGIGIQPSGSGSVRAVIDRTVMSHNTHGLVVDGSGSSGRSVAEINDSVVASNFANGITVNQAGMVINRTAVQANAGNGILAGPGALVHLNSSIVAANVLGGLAYNGGQILSYQNNATKGNGTDNPPSAVLTLN